MSCCAKLAYFLFTLSLFLLFNVLGFAYNIDQHVKNKSSWKIIHFEKLLYAREVQVFVADIFLMSYKKNESIYHI